jgi:hypothetical protein
VHGFYSSFISTANRSALSKPNEPRIHIMNANTMISKALGVAGAAITGIAFVSLFVAMGASASSAAKAEAANAKWAAMPIVKAERIEVVGKAAPTHALNTRGAKKVVL